MRGRTPNDRVLTSIRNNHMSFEKCLGDVCMDIAESYFMADCGIYPVTISFDLPHLSVTAARAAVCDDLAHLCRSLPPLLERNGYDVDTDERDVTILGFHQLGFDPASHCVVSAVCSVAICLSQPESEDQSFDELANASKAELMRDCKFVTDLEADCAFGEDGSVSVLLEGAFRSWGGRRA